MGMSAIETPLLVNDTESQASSKMSQANVDYVALSGSSSAAATESHATAAQDALGFAQWRSGRTVATICCIAAVLFLSAAFVSYNMRLQAGYGPGENIARADGDREYAASHTSFQAEDDLVENFASGDAEYHQASHTSFHYQPIKNFMGDPCGPTFYKGYYHFFYQYNPLGALWDSPSWGHTVSTDLIHWQYLEPILSPDQWYDEFGTWSGSITILADGTPAILYTGARTEYDGNGEQSQNLALPADASDPLLREWRKVDYNPVLFNPDSIKPQDFRDPSSAWLEDDGLWRMTVGTKDAYWNGFAMMFTSSDFVHWKLEDQLLHAINGTGIWECVDLYPVELKEKSGLKNRSALQAERYLDSYKYVLKVSVNEIWQDQYVLGSYSTKTHTFTPDDPALDLGFGLQYDYGKFYASRTFYDPSTGRRILWGYSNESDSESDRLAKGWACVQAIPRTIWLDGTTMKHVVQWPVEEVEALRGAHSSLQNLELQPTDTLKVAGGYGTQLDISVVFEKPNVSSVEEITPESAEYTRAPNYGGKPHSTDYYCTKRGSADRGVFGPFGLLVHTDQDMIERTAVFFYFSLLQDGRWATRVCSDQSRSSLAPGVDKQGFGSQFTVLPTENELSLRILVDHSLVETFVQGGRLAVTSRVYPTIAIGSKARTFLFNNGTTPIKVKSLDVYQMDTVTMSSI